MLFDHFGGMVFWKQSFLQNQPMLHNGLILLIALLPATSALLYHSNETTALEELWNQENRLSLS